MNENDSRYLIIEYIAAYMKFMKVHDIYDTCSIDYTNSNIVSYN